MAAIPDTARTALVLGASGGIGGEVARQLRDAGWRVRALKRSLGGKSSTHGKNGTRHEGGIEWLQG
uniref:NmrA family NAD(P)-binding protein n=1 Tax=Paraburkholderia sp. TaxID=1926495 RepID=UPI00286F232B